MRVGVQWDCGGRASEGQHWASWLLPGTSQQQDRKQRSSLQASTHPDMSRHNGSPLLPWACPVPASPAWAVSSVHSACSAHISPPLSSQPRRGTALCSTDVNKDHYRNVCKFVSRFPGSIFPSSRMPQFVLPQSRRCRRMR